MSSLFTVLEKIKARPGIYLGRASVSDLFMFIVGYRTAREELEMEPTNTELDFYGEFQPWLQQRLQLTTSNSWARMIEFGCSDEKEAFEQFFRLLNEFSQRNAIAASTGSVDLLEVRR
jgi:hypothetical protein